jgi:hypothetical protein
MKAPLLILAGRGVVAKGESNPLLTSILFVFASLQCIWAIGALGRMGCASVLYPPAAGPGRWPSSFLADRGSSSARTPNRRIKSSIASSPVKLALWWFCTCSMRPRQRGPAADHSRQKRTTKVLTGGVGCGSDMATQVPGTFATFRAQSCA